MLILENRVMPRMLIFKDLDMPIVGEERKKTINKVLDVKHRGW